MRPFLLVFINVNDVFLNIIELHNLWWLHLSPFIFLKSSTLITCTQTNTHIHTCTHTAFIKHVQAGWLFATQSLSSRVSHSAMTGIILSIRLSVMESNAAYEAITQVTEDVCLIGSPCQACTETTHTSINIRYHIFAPPEAEWFCCYQITNQLKLN